MSQADAIAIARAYVAILKEAGIEIDKAFLYGSYARGEATEESDIDIMLVSRAFDTYDDYTLSQPWLYTTKVDHRIEPVAIGLKRFMNDNLSPIIDVVRQTGIEIV